MMTPVSAVDEHKMMMLLVAHWSSTRWGWLLLAAFLAPVSLTVIASGLDGGIPAGSIIPFLC